jgi:hypothetical protein
MPDEDKKIDGAVTFYMVRAAEHMTELRMQFAQLAQRTHRGEVLREFYLIPLRKSLRELKRSLEMVEFSIRTRDK